MHLILLGSISSTTPKRTKRKRGIQRKNSLRCLPFSGILGRESAKSVTKTNKSRKRPKSSPKLERSASSRSLSHSYGGNKSFTFSSSNNDKKTFKPNSIKRQKSFAAQKSPRVKSEFQKHFLIKYEPYTDYFPLNDVFSAFVSDSLFMDVQEKDGKKIRKMLLLILPELIPNHESALKDLSDNNPDVPEIQSLYADRYLFYGCTPIEFISQFVQATYGAHNNNQDTLLYLTAHQIEAIFSLYYKHLWASVNHVDLINFMCCKTKVNPLKNILDKFNSITNWFGLVLTNNCAGQRAFNKQAQFSKIYELAIVAYEKNNLNLLSNITSILSEKRIQKVYSKVASDLFGEDPFSLIETLEEKVMLTDYFKNPRIIAETHDEVLPLAFHMMHGVNQTREVPTIDDDGAVNVSKLISVYKILLFFYKWDPGFMSLITGREIARIPIEALDLKNLYEHYEVIDTLGDFSEGYWSDVFDESLKDV